MFTSLIAFVLMLCASVVQAEPAEKFAREVGIPPPRSREPVQLGTEAKAIGHAMVCRCETCPGHPVDECSCGWAEQQRKVIDAALKKGMTGEQILDAYRRAYGGRGMTDVPDTPMGRLAYILPYAAGACGFALFVWWGMRMRARNRASAEGPSTEEDDLEVDADAQDRAILSRALDDLD